MLGFDPLDKMSFRDAFAFAKERGLVLQIQLEPPLFWFEEGQVRTLVSLRREFPDVPLILHAPYREVFLGSPFRAVREAGVSLVLQTIDLAADLDAPVVVFHAGEVKTLIERDIALSFAREAVGRILEAAKERGVTAALENAPFWRGSLLLYPSDFVSLGLDVPICLDIPHAYAVDALDAFLDLLGDRVVVYHISDTVKGRDLHKPVGEGEIPWRSVLSRMDAKKPRILEVGGRENVEKSLEILGALGYA